MLNKMNIPYKYIKAPISFRYKEQVQPVLNSWEKKMIDPESFYVSKTSITSLVFITIGISLISTAVWPLAMHTIFYKNQASMRIISPIIQAGKINSDSLTSDVLANSDINQNQLITNARDWFPKHKTAWNHQVSITHYSISIPKLDIKNATVEINGKDLSKNLIQYPSTELPGKYGNPVIFGHSVLPAFYNPEDYNTIFSKIPTLKTGDLIYVDFDGIRYTYEVYDYFDVSPKDLSVLRQSYDQKYLTLITCTPPGTYLKRGVVKARLK